MGSKLKGRRLKKISNWDKIFIKFSDYALKCAQQDHNLDVLRHTRNPEDQKQNLLKSLESGELEYPPEVLSLVCQLEGLEKRFLEKGSTLLWKLSFVENYATLLREYWQKREAFEAKHVEVTKFDPKSRFTQSDIIDLICDGEADSSDSESDCDSDSDSCSESDASSQSSQSEKKKKKERKRRRDQRKQKKKKAARVKTEPASTEPASSSGAHLNETTAQTSSEAATRTGRDKQVTLFALFPFY